MQIMSLLSRTRILPVLRRIRLSSTIAHDAVVTKPVQKARLVPQNLDRPELRREVFRRNGINPYPRQELSLWQATRIRTFRSHYEKKFAAGERKPLETMLVRGRIQRVREISKKLIFVDLVEDGHKLQIVFNLKESGLQEPADFHNRVTAVRPGDFISVYGYAGATSVGELSLFAKGLPKLLSPCLHPMPTTSIVDAEKRRDNRHLDLLVNKSAAETLRLRSEIIAYIRHFLMEREFMEVQTPILARNSGGALAKPFITHAAAEPLAAKGPLALRIAPELWLKRLVVSGFDRVFEIGPQFRNEGVDATHSPEFYSCEFYQAFASLTDLMNMTEELLKGLARRINYHASRYRNLPSGPAVNNPEDTFCVPFKRVEFFPAVEKGLGDRLPMWTDGVESEEEQARIAIMEMMTARNIRLPSVKTLPKLLDKLCETFAEPGPGSPPTFVMNHPVALSPLAKSAVDPLSGRKIAMRMELFVKGKEVVNAYEEENDPEEQRRKMLSQKGYKGKGDDEAHTLDEDYCHVLEWGLPPTGGWGCGIERLTMLFSGQERIEDVISFGGMRG